MFNIQDFKERKNSINSDFGNITIFKELFNENSINFNVSTIHMIDSRNNHME